MSNPETDHAAQSTWALFQPEQADFLCHPRL
jgi:hypothetical protein